MNLSMQEMFDKVWERAKDKRKAVTPSRRCRYRNYAGLKCFVGELLSDEEYRPGMEGKPVAQLGLFAGRELALLENFQLIHDVEAPNCWAVSLTQVARRFNLEVPR